MRLMQPSGGDTASAVDASEGAVGLPGDAVAGCERGIRWGSRADAAAAGHGL